MPTTSATAAASVAAPASITRPRLTPASAKTSSVGWPSASVPDRPPGSTPAAGARRVAAPGVDLQRLLIAAPSLGVIAADLGDLADLLDPRSPLRRPGRQPGHRFGSARPHDRAAPRRAAERRSSGQRDGLPAAARLVLVIPGLEQVVHVRVLVLRP